MKGWGLNNVMALYGQKFFPALKFQPKPEPWKLRDILEKTLLAPLNASLAFTNQVIDPKPNTSPLEQAWKTFRGKQPAIRGVDIAKKMDFAFPELGGFMLEFGLDPLIWLPMGKLAGAFKSGTKKGLYKLGQNLSKYETGAKLVESAKTARKATQNIFTKWGYLPTRKELGLLDNTAGEMKPLLERFGFDKKMYDSVILDSVTTLAKKYKNLPDEQINMIASIIEKGPAYAIKVHQKTPFEETLKLAQDTTKLFNFWHNKEIEILKKAPKTLKSIGYFPGIPTPEFIQKLRKIYPKIYFSQGKIFIPKHKFTTRRTTGFLDVPIDWISENRPRLVTIKKFFNAETNTYRIPLSYTIGHTNIPLAGKIAKQIRKTGEIPKFQFFTKFEINEMGRLGKLPILRGEKVDKVFETNPFLTLAQRNIKTATAINNQNFLNTISAPETAGGFSRLAKEVKNDKFWNRSPIVANNVKGGEKLRFPNEIIPIIERANNMFQSPDEIKSMLALHDKVLSMWKRWTLLPIPGYHIRNEFGNIWNNYLKGMNLDDFWYYIKAANITNGKKGKLGAYTFDEWRKLIVTNNIRGRGFYSVETKSPDFIKELKQVLDPKMTRYMNPLEIGRVVQIQMEDNARIAHFLWAVDKKKMSPYEAYKSVAKTLFDYSELSLAEKNIFRRIIPFYAWSRKNLPFQLESVITNPGRWSIWAKMARNIELQDKPDERYMPDWLKQAIPIALRKDPKSGEYQYFILYNWLPAGDLQDLFKGDTLLEMMSPIIKAPLEWFTNYSSFAERSIEAYPDQVQNYLGMNMPRKVANLIRNVRVLNEVDRANPGFIFGTKTTPGILGFHRSQELELPDIVRLVNLMGGLKFYPYHFDIAKRQYEKVLRENILTLDRYRRLALRQNNFGEANRITKLIQEQRGLIR